MICDFLFSRNKIARGGLRGFLRSKKPLPLGASEDLERKARFPARSAGKAPEFRIGVRLQTGFGKGFVSSQFPL
jgi:hypothetical protein